MFVEYIYVYMYIYVQYNPETTRRNTPKLKHFISIEKTKYLSKQNQQPEIQYPKPNKSLWTKALIFLNNKSGLLCNPFLI